MRKELPIGISNYKEIFRKEAMYMNNTSSKHVEIV